MSSSLSSIIVLLFFVSLISYSNTISLQKTKSKTSKNSLQKGNTIDEIWDFADSATSMLQNVTSNGQAVQKKISPVKDYYTELEKVLANFKSFLTEQTAIVTPSIAESESSFKAIESKFTQMTDMANTINQTVSAVSSVLPSNEYVEKLQAVNGQVNDIAQGVNKYKGYSSNINTIIKEINEKFDAMKQFDENKIVELKTFLEEYDGIAKELENMNSYINELMSVSTKATGDVVQESKNKLGELLGSSDSTESTSGNIFTKATKIFDSITKQKDTATSSSSTSSSSSSSKSAGGMVKYYVSMSVVVALMLI